VGSDVSHEPKTPVYRRLSYAIVQRRGTVPPSRDHSADETVEAIIELRRKHPSWGPKKLLKILCKRRPHTVWPARATVASILNRYGLVEKRRRRAFPGHPGRPMTPMDPPNEVWCADFKGEFKTRDGIYCYQLTITDGCPRFLLECRGLRSTAHDLARPVFQNVFRDYGLPGIIRTDNGTPFATTALARLSRLSVWWIRRASTPS